MLGDLGPLSLAALNAADRTAFAVALGGVFEHSPWVAEAAWPARPFADIDALHQAMTAAVRGASSERRLDLIRAHPDLAGRAARAGTLTANSAAEQGGAGLLALSEAEFERFHRLNSAYRARFGFPFVIAVRQHTKESLLAAFETRLGNSPEVEIEAALQQILVITRLRLETMLGSGRAQADG